MDVIVSMKDSGRRMVYHRPECIYVRRMKRENRMRLTQEWAENHGYCCCKYCGGLRGEMRTDNQIEEWKKTYHISIDYVKQTDTLYVRTGIGCWKIFYKESVGRYVLYHRNQYDKNMSLRQAANGMYHRQSDVKPTSSLHRLVRYIVEHDKAKLIIMDDYRKLPRETALQRKYYRKAEKKAKSRERKMAWIRLEDLFRQIEEQDPEIRQLAIY